MGTTPRIPEAEWDVHKAQIAALYPTMTLAELMDRMKKDYGFCPTRYQYVRKLNKWGIWKNATKETLEYANTQTRKRKLDGKETEVTIKGRVVGAKKLKRAARRYACSGRDARQDSDLVIVDVPDGVIVRTPPSQVANIINYSQLPWFQFQDLLESFIWHLGKSFSSSRFTNHELFPDTTIPVLVNDVNNGQLQFPMLSSFQSISSDQFLMGGNPFVHREQSASPSRDVVQINREARVLLGECLDESIDPDTPEFGSKIASNLEAVTIERQWGDFVRHIQGLYGPTTVEAPLQLLRYAVYLCSNNMLNE